ncbi:MAG: NADP-dependent isocitrate dehydrogenase [Cyclobacteriaceae bacterium]
MLAETIEPKSKSEKRVRTKVAVAKGDGIGPEIMDATLEILGAAGADIEPRLIDVGERVYLSGNSAGISDQAWDVINDAKILLKAPITTPQGSGYKSLNVTIRKSLNLFANVRPCKSMHPYVKTLHPGMDVVIVRENEEDLYAGIEHQQTDDVIQCLKLVTKSGSERIIRYAFEYARQNKRKKVTCMVKDNIMKHTDGMFHRVFDVVGGEYPDIEKEVQIIDIGAARLASRPENYDVVVTLNLYGDIISDITAEIAGSVGLAGSANIGRNYAMFEAIHGSAPDITGENMANPSGLINAAVMMLQHIGQASVAEKIANAWLKTLEDGIHTEDVFNQEFSKMKVTTSAFAKAVIERLGEKPAKLNPVSFKEGAMKLVEEQSLNESKSQKMLVGVDVFLDSKGADPNALGNKLRKATARLLQLKMITNRGVKVYPNGNPETFCTDHWRCRFVNPNVDLSGKPNYQKINLDDVVKLMSGLIEDGYDVIKTENLYYFGSERGFTLGQGE